MNPEDKEKLKRHLDSLSEEEADNALAFSKALSGQFWEKAAQSAKREIDSGWTPPLRPLVLRWSAAVAVASLAAVVLYSPNPRDPFSENTSPLFAQLEFAEDLEFLEDLEMLEAIPEEDWGSL